MVMRPLDPQELLEQCELAGEADVLEVAADPDGHGTLAKLRFRKIVKGRVQRYRNEPADLAIVKMRGSTHGPSGEPILGAWSDRYQAGTTVFTHLNWSKDGGGYETSWWNAVTHIRRSRGFWKRLFG